VSESSGLKPKTVVFIIPVKTEWDEAILYFGLKNEECSRSPYGGYFFKKYELEGKSVSAVFMKCGCGKARAAGATQFAILKWKPAAIVNIGTCGGFAGSIEKGGLLIAERTVVYDVRERMGDPDEMIRLFSTDLDLSFVSEELMKHVKKHVLASADADLDPGDIASLREKYGAAAADWESGSIASTAALNGVRSLIIRGVSDLVCEKEGGEAYGNYAAFVGGTRQVMKKILELTPEIIDCVLK